MTERSELLREFNEVYWHSRPDRFDVRGWSLLVPSIASAVGFCAFAILAFSFTELQTLPADFRRWLVIVGSVALALGGEVGTLTTVVEIFRKDGAAQAWDWVGFVISILATIAAFVLAFAALLGVSATWSAWVRMWGPIVLGVLAALDSYVNFAELGLYLATYDERLQTWEERHNEDARQYAEQWYGFGRAPETQSDAFSTLPPEAEAQPLPQSEHEAQAEQPQSEPEEFACEHCGRTFGSPQAVSAHLRFCDAREQKDSGRPL